MFHSGGKKFCIPEDNFLKVVVRRGMRKVFSMICVMDFCDSMIISVMLMPPPIYRKEGHWSDIELETPDAHLGAEECVTKLPQSSDSR